MGKIYQTFNLEGYDVSKGKVVDVDKDLLGPLSRGGYEVLFSNEKCFGGVPHSVIVGFDLKEFRNVKKDFYTLSQDLGLSFASGTYYVSLEGSKPLEIMLMDVKEGDHVKVNLDRYNSDFVGYVWKPEGKYEEIVNGEVIIKDARESFLKNVHTLLGGKDSEIFLSSLNPYGTTGDFLDKVQFVGLNVKNKDLAGLEAVSYEIIKRRAQSSSA